MLYISGYINHCLINTFGMISQFFTTLNSCIIPEDEIEVIPRYTNQFYNYSHLSKMEEVVIYEQPHSNSNCMRRTRSDPNLKLQFIEAPHKKKDSEWDIL